MVLYRSSTPIINGFSEYSCTKFCSVVFLPQLSVHFNSVVVFTPQSFSRRAMPSRKAQADDDAYILPQFIMDCKG